MGLFGKRKEKVVDWTEKLRKQQEQVDHMSSESSGSYNYPESSTTSETSASPFPFFAGVGANNDSSSVENQRMGSGGLSADDKRRRLTKRLLDMTEKIEDLSNQVYKLQQRIEVLERKNENSY